VTGTEVSEAGASYAKQAGLDVRMGQLTEIDVPAASFDIVTLWHVLEHVPNPHLVLRKVYAVLKPGGMIAVAVPNEENFLVRRRFGRVKMNPFAPLPFGGEIHLSYFRPATLRATLRAAGFDVVEFGVDDLYQERGLTMKIKLNIQSLLAKLFHWHFAVAMYAICRKRDAT
jgi:2-polyprenyl-3-methyl-5-hydroxy-6-metoxy-1,4-benzoquinol methylase